MSDSIPNGAAVPDYLHDRKLRISIARVGGRLYTFDDLWTCADEACPLSGGLLTETTIMCQCHGSRFDITSGAVINRPASEPLNVHEYKRLETALKSNHDLVLVEVRSRGSGRPGAPERVGRRSSTRICGPPQAELSRPQLG
jgi:nitrite reductase/ring-hydroxylating ferredoxin subunit